eukprot:TRINITY_DN800_c3_g1_i1.p1 TRINITY_DN800_c3_g1~~TRINITY_DN800_c3_g1_i1.p1  ORF type:complete len:207 (-),score=55.71 TRINITY_DN800_c3_g1_i1:155-775(-)
MFSLSNYKFSNSFLNNISKVRFSFERFSSYSRINRGIVTPKTTSPRFYKGRGCTLLGRHTKKGGFIIQHYRIPQLVVPDLTDCQLKPYVSKTTPKLKVAPPKQPTLIELLKENKIFLKAINIKNLDKFKEKIPKRKIKFIKFIEKIKEKKKAFKLLPPEQKAEQLEKIKQKNQQKIKMFSMQKQQNKKQQLVKQIAQLKLKIRLLK